MKRLLLAIAVAMFSTVASASIKIVEDGSASVGASLTAFTVFCNIGSTRTEDVMYGYPMLVLRYPLCDRRYIVAAHDGNEGKIGAIVSTDEDIADAAALIAEKLKSAGVPKSKRKAPADVPTLCDRQDDAKGWTIMCGNREFDKMYERMLESYAEGKKTSMEPYAFERAQDQWEWSVLGACSTESCVSYALRQRTTALETSEDFLPKEITIYIRNQYPSDKIEQVGDLRVDKSAPEAGRIIVVGENRYAYLINHHSVLIGAVGYMGPAEDVLHHLSRSDVKVGITGKVAKMRNGTITLMRDTNVSLTWN